MGPFEATRSAHSALLPHRSLDSLAGGYAKSYRSKGMNGPIAVTFAAGGRMYVSNFGVEGGGSGPPDAIVEFPPHQQVPGKWMITQGLYLPGSLAFYPPAAP